MGQNWVVSAWRIQGRDNMDKNSHCTISHLDRNINKMI